MNACGGKCLLPLFSSSGNKLAKNVKIVYNGASYISIMYDECYGVKAESRPSKLELRVTRLTKILRI